MNNTNLNDSGLLSSCMLTDADDYQNHSTLKLVSAVTNYKQDAASCENLDL